MKTLHFRIYRYDWTNGSQLGTAIALKDLLESEIHELQSKDKIFVSCSGKDGPYEEVT